MKRGRDFLLESCQEVCSNRWGTDKAVELSICSTYMKNQITSALFLTKQNRLRTVLYKKKKKKRFCPMPSYNFAKVLTLGRTKTAGIFGLKRLLSRCASVWCQPLEYLNALMNI